MWTNLTVRKLLASLCITEWVFSISTKNLRIWISQLFLKCTTTNYFVVETACISGLFNITRFSAYSPQSVQLHVTLTSILFRLHTTSSTTTRRLRRIGQDAATVTSQIDSDWIYSINVGRERILLILEWNWRGTEIILMFGFGLGMLFVCVWGGGGGGVCVFAFCFCFYYYYFLFIFRIIIIIIYLFWGW